MKNTSEQLLSFAENELVQKESIRRSVLKSAPQPQKAPVPWLKILLPVAACLVLLCGVVLAIPSARAEVARWLRIERPAQYLTEDPENRAPVEALDELIVKPVETDSVTPAGPDANGEPAFASLPNGSVTDNRIRYSADEPLWNAIADDFSVTIGETMFDGEYLYIAVTLKGMTTLPVLDQLTGSTLVSQAIPLDELAAYYEDGKVPQQYRDGTQTDYEWYLGARYALIFEDGTELWLGPVTMLDSNPELGVFKRSLISEFGEEPYTDAVREQLNARMLSWAPDAELTGVLRHPIVGPNGSNAEPVVQNGALVQVDDIYRFLLDRTDEDGMLRATLRYRDNDADSGKTLLEADIGTAVIDMTAIDTLPKKDLTGPDAPVSLGNAMQVLSVHDWVVTPYDETTAAITNIEADVSDVTFKALPGGYRSGLGIRDVQAELTLPGDWSEQVCDAFLSALSFYADANGARYAAGYSVRQLSSHRFLLTVGISGIPYADIEAIDAFRLIPVLEHDVAMRADGEIIPLEPNVQLVAPDAEHVGCDGELTAYPDAALLFTVQP